MDTGSLTRLRLAGQQYDQGTRLYYLRARYYDPQLGRFLSEDPIGISGGLNLYAYAGNDPVNMWDPSGTSGMGPGDKCRTEKGFRGVEQNDGSCVVELPDIIVNSGYGDHGGQLTGIPLPALPTSPSGVSGLTGGGGGGLPVTSGSRMMNRATCVLARALQPVAIAVDFAAIYDGSKAIGALAEGGFNMTVGSFTRATANLSGRITRSRRLSTGLLAMAGEAQSTEGMLALADVTSVSIVSQDNGIRSSAEIPNALSDVFLTPQVFETVQACTANGY